MRPMNTVIAVRFNLRNEEKLMNSFTYSSEFETSADLITSCGYILFELFATSFNTHVCFLL